MWERLPGLRSDYRCMQAGHALTVVLVFTCGSKAQQPQELRLRSAGLYWAGTTRVAQVLLQMQTRQQQKRIK